MVHWHSLDALPSDKMQTHVPNPHTLALNPGPQLYLKVACSLSLSPCLVLNCCSMPLLLPPERAGVLRHVPTHVLLPHAYLKT